MRTNYAEVNLGLKQRIVSGLEWVFDSVEAAILLEDDCVADPSFFQFCDELLARYRDAPLVMTVSGNNFQFGRRSGSGGYYLSRYPHLWGWATWRRAWRLYDAALGEWPGARDNGWLHEIFADRTAVQ